MRIKEVSYRRLVSRPGFQHEAIEMCAEIEAGDSWPTVLAELRRLVADQLGASHILDDSKRPEMRERLREAILKIEAVSDEVFAEPLPF